MQKDFMQLMPNSVHEMSKNCWKLLHQDNLWVLRLHLLMQWLYYLLI